MCFLYTAHNILSCLHVSPQKLLDLLVGNSVLGTRVSAEQNHDIIIANRCFDNVAQFKYLETTIRNQNLIQEEIKRRLNSGNACYHSAQKAAP
jgi:hypothetical protein